MVEIDNALSDDGVSEEHKTNEKPEAFDQHIA